MFVTQKSEVKKAQFFIFLLLHIHIFIPSVHCTLCALCSLHYFWFLFLIFFLFNVSFFSDSTNFQSICSSLRTALATGLALAMSVDMVLNQALLGEEYYLYLFFNALHCTRYFWFNCVAFFFLRVQVLIAFFRSDDCSVYSDWQLWQKSSYWY